MIHAASEGHLVEAGRAVLRLRDWVRSVGVIARGRTVVLGSTELASRMISFDVPPVSRWRVTEPARSGLREA